MTTSTQIKHPWRTTGRSIFQGLVAAAAVAPFVYTAATNHDAALATGLAATGLGIAAAITRIMAMPIVDAFLTRFVPFLATQPAGADTQPTSTAGTVGNLK